MFLTYIAQLRFANPSSTSDPQNLIQNLTQASNVATAILDDLKANFGTLTKMSSLFTKLRLGLFSSQADDSHSPNLSSAVKAIQADARMVATQSLQMIGRLHEANIDTPGWNGSYAQALEYFEKARERAKDDIVLKKGAQHDIERVSEKMGISLENIGAKVGEGRSQERLSLFETLEQWVEDNLGLLRLRLSGS